MMDRRYLDGDVMAPQLSRLNPQNTPSSLEQGFTRTNKEGQPSLSSYASLQSLTSPRQNPSSTNQQPVAASISSQNHGFISHRTADVSSTLQNHQTSQADASVARLLSSRGRLEYLLAEHAWLQNRVKDLASQAAQADDDFNILRDEIKMLNSEFGTKKQSKKDPLDLDFYRNKDPTPFDRDELLEIVAQQKEIIESLKLKKKSKKAKIDDIEEEPRLWDTEKQNQDADHQAFDEEFLKHFSIGKNNDFATFGKLPESEPISFPIRSHESDEKSKTHSKKKLSKTKF